MRLVAIVPAKIGEANDPVWIDWRRATDGGLRFITYTDEAGEPHLGCADLDRAGQMTTDPVFSPHPLESFYHTGIFRTAPGKRQLLRFSVKATGRGFTVAVRPLPSHSYQAEARTVLWLDDNPAVRASWQEFWRLPVGTPLQDSASAQMY
jgi:hypothetical protein